MNKDTEKCIKWIVNNYDLNSLSIKDIIDLSLTWAAKVDNTSDVEHDIDSEDEDSAFLRKNIDSPASHLTNPDYRVTKDKQGNLWYERMHLSAENKNSRKLKPGDIIQFHSTDSDGVMVVRSFDFESDFAARSYIQLFYWDEKLGFSKDVNFGYDYAPAIKSFSFATEEEIKHFFDVIKNKFKKEYDFYCNVVCPDFMKRYEKYLKDYTNE